MHYSNEISLTLFHNLECSNYIRILSPLILFMCLDNIADNILKGLDKQFEVMLYNVIDLIITIIILYNNHFFAHNIIEQLKIVRTLFCVQGGFYVR